MVRNMIIGADFWLYPSNTSNWCGMKDCIYADDSYESVDQKSHVRVFIVTRTANRHRCSGREDQGERVNLR